MQRIFTRTNRKKLVFFYLAIVYIKIICIFVLDNIKQDIMKLELEHYLDAFKYKHPVRLSKQGLYNLDFEYPDFRFSEVGFISSISIDDTNISGELSIGNLGADFDFDLNSISDLELILRPLSDLTKEITVNGVTFIPTKALSMWDLENITIVNIPHIPVNLYELLLKWHFDIFGLIENGLAIDINTLQQ